MEPVSTDRFPPTHSLPIPAEFQAREGERTFQFQDSLPDLPQPDLEKTLSRYLDSVRPLTTDEEYSHTKQLVTSFGEGIGKDLHGKFLQRTNGMRNWLSKWWEDKAYLESRIPTTPYFNIGGPGPYMEDLLPPTPGSQIERAAIILYGSCVHWLSMRRELIKVDKAMGLTMCMHQYHRACNSMKTPGATIDKLNFHFLTESEGDCPSHITISCRGRLFSFDVLDEDGNLVTIPELQRNLQHIRDLCDREPEQPSMAPLTTTDRITWAQRYEHLCGLHPDNVRSLKMRETSILTMILEDSPGVTAENLMTHALGGDCKNRWADKSVSLSIYTDGTLSSNCDHAPFDGLVIVMATHFSHLLMTNMNGIWQGSMEVRDLALPVEHKLHADEGLLKAAQEATTQYEMATANLDTRQPKFTGFGKSWIRSHGLHPDTFVQMALQFAYYRTYKRPCATYETATLRKYYHGRTETVRVCTPESLAWTQSMCDPTVNEDTQFAHLLKAIDKQNTLMLEATDMQGCDRHLLALSIIAEEEGLPLPDIYTDSAWTKTGGGGNFTLSTSFVGYTACLGSAVAMTEDGYGCFYSIQPNNVNFAVNSYRSCPDTDSLTFYNTIAACLQDMRELIDKKHTARKSKM